MNRPAKELYVFSHDFDENYIQCTSEIGSRSYTACIIAMVEWVKDVVPVFFRFLSTKLVTFL